MNAVIKQAAIDCQKALCGLHNTKSTTKKIAHQRMIADCERFFTGNRIILFTDADGKRLMNLLKQEVIDFKYDYKAILESRKPEKEEE